MDTSAAHHVEAREIDDNISASGVIDVGSFCEVLSQEAS